LQAWEPVIYFGGRGYMSRVDARRLDALVHVARPRMTDPERVIGAKPAAFCFWMFGLMGALPCDEFDDLYPGSGGVARAWSLYQSRNAGATGRVALGSRRRVPGEPDASR
jgi:hypothetical protein